MMVHHVVKPLLVTLKSGLNQFVMLKIPLDKIVMLSSFFVKLSFMTRSLLLDTISDTWSTKLWKMLKLMTLGLVLNKNSSSWSKLVSTNFPMDGPKLASLIPKDNTTVVLVPPTLWVDKSLIKLTEHFYTQD